MSIFHNSTRLNRPPEVRDKATAGLRSNRFKVSIIEKWLCVVLCLVFVFSALGVAVPRAAHAAEEGYLLDRVITWGDGTTETVRIDKDGFFVLDGVKRRLVGFCDPLQFTTGYYWDDANIAILHAELDYLQSVGVRVIHMQIGVQWSGIPARYDALLQLYYDHKMLVIPIFAVRGGGDGWDNLTTLDWVVPATGHLDMTVTEHLTQWINHVKAFSNVVAIVLENELDYLGPWGEVTFTYNVTQVRDYMSLLYTTARPLTTLPLVTKFVPYNYNAFALSAQNALIPYSAVACMDTYNSTAAGFTDACNNNRTWYLTKSKPSQMWILETNYINGGRGGYDATKMTKAMVDALLAANASVVMLFNMYGSVEPAAQFFTSAGAPIANCETLMANMATWQAPISQPAPTPVIATTGAKNITLPSVKTNSNPISTSKVQSASKPGKTAR